MISGVLVLELVAYSLALWLGLYLLGRDWTNLRLRYAGLGLLAYALSLATALLARYASTDFLALFFSRLHWPMLFLPAFCWLGTIIYLLPEQASLRVGLRRLWPWLWLPVVVPIYLLGSGTNLIFDYSGGQPQPGPAYLLFSAAVAAPLLGALFLAWQTFRATRPKLPLGLLLAATIFVALGAGLLIYPLDWLPRPWLLLAISLDFVALGVAIALLDAFDQGETLSPDFVRSFDGALVGVLLFGSPVALTMALATGFTFSMLALLLTMVTLAIASQTLADPLQAGLDRLAFAAFPRLRQARSELRTAASVLPKVKESLDPASLADDEFERLTRRALSHMGNLPRLASSPLTRLPLIYRRLAERGAGAETLERAAELKLLLAESIDQLKPPGDDPFGATDEWRYYNALYFPYVVGLKPYSRRATHDDLDAAAQAALDWFRASVPERTLYNWQTAAARLIAQHLRERLRNRQ